MNRQYSLLKWLLVVAGLAAMSLSGACGGEEGTGNPPIEITLDGVGVYETGEHWLRGAPEQYVRIVVTDGITTYERRIPSEGYYLSLEYGDVTDIGTRIFSTEEVGDYLRLFVIAYEVDNSDFERFVTQALGTAVLGSLTGGAGMGIEGLFGPYLGDLIGGLIGSEDDHLGTYEQVWFASDQWGVGRYQDIASDNLRLWFTIKQR